MRDQGRGDEPVRRRRRVRHDAPQSTAETSAVADVDAPPYDAWATEATADVTDRPRPGRRPRSAQAGRPDGHDHDPPPGVGPRESRPHDVGPRDVGHHEVGHQDTGPHDAGQHDLSATERGLRGLVGGGSSQVSLGAAMRARDAGRPHEADLARAEEQLVVVRRHWLPRDHDGSV